MPRHQYRYIDKLQSQSFSGRIFSYRDITNYHEVYLIHKQVSPYEGKIRKGQQIYFEEKKAKEKEKRKD